MPIYEYKCWDCYKTVEKLHKDSDEPEVFCPKCGKRIKRIISPVHIRGIFKWYKPSDFGKGGR